MSWRKRCSYLTAMLLLLLSATDAHADKVACVAASESAQSLHADHKLKAARAQYVACASNSCPAVVREDCARSLLSVDAAMPTAVFSASDGDGRDITDVRVFVDGSATEASADGHAVTLDPGSHTVRFERQGEAPVTLHVVAREGEKNRSVHVSIGPPRAPRVTPSALRFDPGQAPQAAPAPVVPIILAGIGALALGSGAYLRLSAGADAADLHDRCAPACDASERDALSNKIVASNVSFGIGVAALAAAAITWILAKPGSDSSAQRVGAGATEPRRIR